MSETYSMQVIGLDELTRRFGAISPFIRKELHRAMYRAVTGELQRMPPYPPAQPGWRRTGLLGRSLTSLVGQATDAASEVRDEWPSLVGVVGTNRAYAPRVIGAAQEPQWSHWWRLHSVVMSHQSQIKAEFDAATERIVEALGD